MLLNVNFGNWLICTTKLIIDIDFVLCEQPVTESYINKI